MDEPPSANRPVSLNPLLHQPLRTRLAALLAAGSPMSFTDLKKQLGASDGNLDSHMKKLTEAGYVNVEKVAGHRKVQSIYSLTDKGEQAFRQYVQDLQALLHSGGQNTDQI